MAPSDKPRGSEPVNLILEGTRLEGELHFSSQLVVAGHVKGNIVCESVLFIERGGLVEGRIQAPSIVVHGNLDGVVLATKSLEICPGANVGGDVSARSVRVDQGAILTANLTISSNLPDSLVPPAPAAPPAQTPEAKPDPGPAGGTPPASFLARSPGLSPR